MRKIIILVILTVLTGCMSANIDKRLNYSKWDKRTEYNITNNHDSFKVTVIYSKYQYFPNFTDVYNGCKDKTLFIAQEEAFKKNKKIIPIDFSKLEVTTGRNEFTGITTCSSNIMVYWDNN